VALTLPLKPALQLQPDGKFMPLLLAGQGTAAHVEM